jgi:hypothetical protein
MAVPNLDKYTDDEIARGVVRLGRDRLLGIIRAIQPRATPADVKAIIRTWTSAALAAKLRS